MIKRLFHSVSEHDKKIAVDEIVRESSPRPELFLMVILGAVLATIGLYLDNAAVVIGSMLITPIMMPILGVALGLGISDYELILRSFNTSLKLMLTSVAASAVVSFVFYNGTSADTQQIIISSQASLGYLIVALAAGCAVAFAMVKPTLSASLPGVAVAVALVPPLAAVGIGISKLDAHITTGALEQLFINVIGVISASLVIFQLMNFYLERNKIEQAVKQDERSIAHDKDSEARK